MAAPWSKLLLFSLTLFLLRIADGIISFWAPNQIQNILNNSLYMGLVVSFQSVVGLSADLIFPRLLGTTKARYLVLGAILVSASTSLFLFSTTIRPFILIILLTMALWGIYYELLGFANYQFIGSTIPRTMRSGAWAINGVFISLAYFIGPLIGAEFLDRGYLTTEIIILLFLAGSLILLLLHRNSHDGKVQIDLKDVNPVAELKHWLTLSEHIWPAIVISILLGFIESTFWTTGAVWTIKLSQIDRWGALFLPLSQLPAIFLGLIIARWGIYKGKKILCEKFLIVAGIFLAGLALSATVAWQLTMVFLASIAIAICYPLIEGVNSDLVARMGKEKNEVIGLTSSVLNISYIIWPPVAGLIALFVGERLTFSVVGVLTILVAVVLLFITPKKLRLPQEEIKTWKN
jgi:MFS family permease